MRGSSETGRMLIQVCQTKRLADWFVHAVHFDRPYSETPDLETATGKA